jgi:PAS domain S-box-containing protein
MLVPIASAVIPQKFHPKNTQEAAAIVGLASTQLSLMFARLPGVMWTTDKNLVLTSAGGTGLAKINWVVEDYLERSLYEIFRTDDPQFPPIAAHLRALEGKSGHYELKINETIFEVTVESLLDTTNQIIGCVALAVDITTQKETERALGYLTDRMILLHRVVSLASSTLDTTKVLELICRELAHTFHVPQVAAALYADDQSTAEIVAEYLAEGCSPALGIRFAVQGSLLNEDLIKFKNPVSIVDVQHSPLLQDVQDLMSQRDVASMLIVPLTVRGEVVGSIGIDSHEIREFTQDEIELAAAVALSLSQALENSILHQELASQNERLLKLVDKRTAELQRANDRMTAILNGSSDAIIFTHNDGTIRNSNEAFDRLFGYDADDLFSAPIGHLAEPPFDELLMDTLKQAVLTNEPQRITITARRSDGSTFDADVALAPVPETHNSLGGAVCSLRDITQLKEVERLKDRFVSTVSHELRTPITGMLLGANSLHQHYARLSDDQRLEIIRRILDQSTSLAELVEGILSLSRFDLQKHRQTFTPVDMWLTLEGVVNELRPNLQNKGLALEIVPPATPAIVLGSKLDFARIWRNLIENAIKYTYEGKISVQLQVIDTLIDQLLPDALRPPDLPAGKYVVAQISDTGHGIPAEDLAHLFTRFYRGYAAQSNIPGSGLGLSLVQEILAHYKGTIAVHSELKVGSTFTFWLPADHE